MQEGISRSNCKLPEYQWIWKFIKLYNLPFQMPNFSIFWTFPTRKWNWNLLIECSVSTQLNKTYWTQDLPLAKQLLYQSGFSKPLMPCNADSYGSPKMTIIFLSKGIVKLNLIMHIHSGYLQPSMNLVAVTLLHAKVRNFYKLKLHWKMEILRLFFPQKLSLPMQILTFSNISI